MFWRRRKSRDEDLERELRSHLEAEAEEQREKGLAPEEARYAARRLLGNRGIDQVYSLRVRRQLDDVDSRWQLARLLTGMYVPCIRLVDIMQATPSAFLVFSCCGRPPP